MSCYNDGMTVLTETPRLRLRQLDPERDAGSMLALLNDPHYIAGIEDHHVRTLAQAADYLRRWPGTHYAENGFGYYALELKASGTFIGTAGLRRRPDLALADLGYALFGEHHGHGYAAEAARAVIAQARETFAMTGVCAITGQDNAASLRLLETLGLRRDGDYRLPGEAQPLAYYALLF